MENITTQVIIAAMNEEEGIGLTIEELKDHLEKDAKITVVDGKSTDRTAEIARDLGAQIILQEGAGKGAALAQGLKAIESGVQYVVITDADHTYPAEYVPQMIRILQQNPHVGMVCGNRINGQLDSTSFHRVFDLGNHLIAFTHSVLNGVPLADPLTGLRVVRAEILRTWKIKSRGFDIEVELNHLVERRGYETVEVPIQYRERLGQKKLGVKHGIEILKRIILETTY